jgi:hypothetical protein
VPDLGGQRRNEVLAVGKARIERIAVGKPLDRLEPVTNVADRSAALARMRKRRSRLAGGCAVDGIVVWRTPQPKSLVRDACTFGATSSTRTR